MTNLSITTKADTKASWIQVGLFGTAAIVLHAWVYMAAIC
jgi:hypothetical protein